LLEYALLDNSFLLMILVTALLNVGSDLDVMAVLRPIQGYREHAIVKVPLGAGSVRMLEEPGTVFLVILLKLFIFLLVVVLIFMFDRFMLLLLLLLCSCLVDIGFYLMIEGGCKHGRGHWLRGERVSEADGGL
jgi:hypothetical protein